MKESNFKNQNYTVIGIDNYIKGDLELKGDIVIHSKIEGTLTVKDTGKVILERSSHFLGTIYCEDIEVFGKIEGNINANGALTVRSSANISGAINAKKISIYPGAILNMEAHAEQEVEQLKASEI